MSAKRGDTRHPVCIVDDDLSVREAVGSLLRSEGMNVETFGSAREFLASPRLDTPSCLVLDVDLPGLSGLDLQQELLKGNMQVPIIFLTGHGDIPMSVRAIKAGALDFLTKPVDAGQLLSAIEKGIAQDHGARMREHGGVIGTSQAWRAVLTQAAKVAPAETTVLLSGESGTGKEVVAHLIHRGSRRAEGPFVALNCAALPEALLESELFGYEKGAFTGAVSARAGRLEQAAGGTLFLDEVGEMSPAVQAKVLRVLQEREFQRLGGTRMLKADVRVIAATNRDLQIAMTTGAFREDLYYRLHVFAIHLPPLRERPEDILPLLEHFVEELGPVVLGRPAAGISRGGRTGGRGFPDSRGGPRSDGAHPDRARAQTPTCPESGSRCTSRSVGATSQVFPSETLEVVPCYPCITVGCRARNSEARSSSSQPRCCAASIRATRWPLHCGSHAAV